MILFVWMQAMCQGWVGVIWEMWLVNCRMKSLKLFILSFWRLKEACGSSILWRRWRDVWKFNRRLHFDLPQDYVIMNMVSKIGQFESGWPSHIPCVEIAGDIYDSYCHQIKSIRICNTNVVTLIYIYIYKGPNAPVRAFS